MRKIKIIILCFFVFLFSSCRKKNAPDCFTPNGNYATEVRELSSITAVELNSNIELTLIQGSEQKVEVIAGEYLIDKITTSVNNGTLVIDNDNKCNFVRGYKHTVRVNLTVPYIKGVNNIGVGDVVFDQAFKQDSILNLSAGNSGDIHINGSFDKIVTSSHGNGDLYFDGTANQLNLYCNGTNYTYAENLNVSGYIYISTYSLGDIYLKLNSKNVLDYFINKDGNIYYSGSPMAANQLSDGSAKGRLIKTD